MQIHEFNLTVRNRAAAVGLGLAALAVAGVFFALGLTLLLGAATVGVVAGTALMLYRRLTGRDGRRVRGAAGLDPSMEVFPARTRDARRLDAPHED